ncbi:c-type cytochrome [Variovorax saccharolyticus]|uniref:c-type cytochrome n=1 Tax=Variovorax saccharolyticus TaxID=3053516 RepID=UPI002574CE12|nr:c-type cytochrome [Variovorax sp. J31P216]MDM0030150.1 c-type cytochrome [Variovorax sp. J31P216]
MRQSVVPSIVGLLLASGAAFADDEMYKTKNCFACHRIDKNYHGPSFQSVAARYAGDKGSDLKLAQKIREGSGGVWGQTPMPPQAQVTEAEALTLARWILDLK